MPTRPTLQPGTQSDSVKDAQSLLNRALSPSPGLDEDGHFGPEMRAAVVDFQRREGLGADGIVGPLTWAKLELRAGEAGGVADGGAPPPPATAVEGPSAGSAPSPPVDAQDAAAAVAVRGMSAFHASRIEIVAGVELYGAGKPWTAPKQNSGQMIDKYQRVTGVLTDKGQWTLPQASAPWCGSFCGFCLEKAGFDMGGPLDKRLNSGGGAPFKRTAFLSAARLYEYLKNRGKFYPEPAALLDFPPDRAVRKAMSKDARVRWLDENLRPFGPQPGDILLLDTIRTRSHVGMVASYDPTTYELVTYEGNLGMRASAWRWNLSELGSTGVDFARLDTIARFPAADFTSDPATAPDAASPDPVIEPGIDNSGRG
jgi:hypothetical protein